MKAVSKIIIPFLLSLAGVVLAAPHPSITRSVRSATCCSSICENPAMSCQEIRNCIVKVELSLPPIHDSNNFQYW